MKKLFTLLVFLPLFSNGQVISTIAGIGVLGYTGDNGPAINAKLKQPSCIVLDKKGNLYFTDAGNSAVRKIDNAGIITTIAGTGNAGYNGDSMLASLAKLYNPWSIAVDDTGNIFVADKGNNRIRKIDTFGMIYTVAGTGIPGYNGDNIQATSAQLCSPFGIALDTTGNIYIADYNNSRIRMVNTSGVITTIAGTGSTGISGDGGPATSATLYNPLGITIDRFGNLYFSDLGNNRIRKFNPFTDNIIKTIAGDTAYGYTGDNVAATTTSLYAPQNIAVDSVGNVYFGDAANNRVRRVDTAGIITTIAGNGISGFFGDGGNPVLAELLRPAGVAIDRTGNLYITDSDNDRIRLINYNLSANNVNNCNQGITAYPNPCHEGFNCMISATVVEPVRITLVNAMGERIGETSTSTNHTIFIPLHFPSGIYFIAATTAHEKYTLKITIE